MRENDTPQMTLGKLIEALETMPPDAEITGLTCPHSYRGYYTDLAFEPIDGSVKACALLDDCQAAIGQAFEGYKGGEYVMNTNTPVWVAKYGRPGDRLIAIHPDGRIESAQDED